MLEMHLRQPGFTYSACGPFTKNKEKIQKLKVTRDSTYICKTKLDQAWNQHDLTNRDFKDLPRKTASDQVLRIRAFIIAKNP